MFDLLIPFKASRPLLVKWNWFVVCPKNKNQAKWDNIQFYSSPVEQTSWRSELSVPLNQGWKHSCLLLYARLLKYYVRALPDSIGFSSPFYCIVLYYCFAAFNVHIKHFEIPCVELQNTNKLALPYRWCIWFWKCIISNFARTPDVVRFQLREVKNLLAHL